MRNVEMSKDRTDIGRVFRNRVSKEEKLLGTPTIIIYEIKPSLAFRYE
jgi:hypothetical protein